MRVIPFCFARVASAALACASVRHQRVQCVQCSMLGVDILRGERQAQLMFRRVQARKSITDNASGAGESGVSAR